MNSKNDRICAPRVIKKCDVSSARLQWTQFTFSKSVMVSVAVSKFGCSNLILVEPGDDIDGAHAAQGLLPRRAADPGTAASHP